MKTFLWTISIVTVGLCIYADGSATTAQLSKFGGKCDSQTDCDSCKFLTCQNEKCGCQYPDDQYWDTEQNSCVFKLGKVCQGYSKCNGVSVPIELAQMEGLAEFCPANARCTSGKCQCKSGFVLSSNGTSCEHIRRYGDSCTNNSECQGTGFLVCSVEGKCDCNSTTSYYENSTQRCATKFGSPCPYYEYCGNNSQCSYVSTYFGSGGGSTHSTYERRCICDSTSYPTPEGKCEPKRDHGAACNTSRECGKNFICKDDVCQCKPEYVYNATQSKCLGLVGTRCDYWTNPCVSGARCRDVNYRYGYWSGRYIRIPDECKCDGDHYMTVNRTCLPRPGYDEECSAEIPCQSSNIDLVCDSGRCKCSGNDTFYFARSNTCVKKLGASCRWSSDCGYNGYGSYGYSNHARCINSKCTCVTYGGTPDSSGKYCLASYYSHCDSSARGHGQKCNKEEGLVCRQGSCQCKSKDHEYYDVTARKCLTYVQGTCNSTTSVCVPNAECTSTGVGDREECQCKNGFVSMNRFCQAGYGQPCNNTRRRGDVYVSLSYYSSVGYWDGSNDQTCDSMGPLYCTNGICQCADLQFYDENELKCKGLVGSKCKLDNETFCAEGSFCKGFRALDYVKKGEGICRCNEGFLTDETGRCIKKDENSTESIK